MGQLVPVTLYTRRNCPLCEDAERIVTEFAGRFPLLLEMRDVDSLTAWRQSFGQEVPVVFVGDRKLFRFRIDEPAFEAAILDYHGSDDGDHT